MNRSSKPDTEFERRLQRYLEHTSGPEPDLERLWARLAPQLGAQQGAAERSQQPLLEGRSVRPAALAPLPRQPLRRSRRLITASIALAAILLITLLTAALLASRPGKNQTIHKPPAGVPWSLYFTDASGLQTDAIDADGHLRWRYERSSYQNLPLTLANGVLYSATWDGQIMAIKGADGSMLWSKEISLNTEHSLRVAQVADGVVYASADIGGSIGYPDERHIYALDATTGKLIWTFQQADAVAQLSDGVLYVYHLPTNDDPPFVQVFALDARDGTMRWHAQVAGLQVQDTLLADGQFYVAVYSGTATTNEIILYALQASDGTTRWHATQRGYLWAGDLLAAQGLVYLLSADNDQPSDSLTAFDVTSGEIRWQHPQGLTGNGVPPLPDAGPFYQHGVIYVAGVDGGVYALRASDGTLIWQRQQEGGQRVQLLAIDGSTLYLSQFTPVHLQLPSQNRLVALNLSDGSRRWQHDLPGTMQGIIIQNGVLYGAWASQPPKAPGKPYYQGQAFALSASDGSSRWSYDDHGLAFGWLLAG